jgi:hypothetical protein
MLAGTVWLISFDRSSNAAPFQDVACLSRKSLDPANRRGQGHNNCHPARSRRRWSQLNGAKRHVEPPICSPGKNGNVEHPFHHPGRCVIFMPGTRAGEFQQVPAEDLEPHRDSARCTASQTTRCARTDAAAGSQLNGYSESNNLIRGISILAGSAATASRGSVTSLTLRSTSRRSSS